MPLVLWLRTKRLQYGEWLYWRRAAIRAKRKTNVERPQQKGTLDSVAAEREAKRPSR